MRFLLDHDVDARLGMVLRAGSHKAWTAAKAGLYRASDDEITIYAQARDATVLTHDRKFSARRRRNPIGRHVQLGCSEPDALQVVPPILDELVSMLAPFDDVFAYVSREGVRLHHTWA